MDYHYFGDVVCFDPTYGTNRYDMPFVPIVGVNHHSQTVLFGGALLYSETEESFEWVMRTWMNAMNGNQPKVIFTDQESTTGGAITRVLPESRHRFCVWHINRNDLKHLAHEINKHKDFLGDLNYCLYQYETVEEFENGWNKMLETYKLKENKWLETLFGKREKWASIYARDIFCAGMYTTQRSEMVDRREEENMADYDTIYHRPLLRVFMEIEKEGAKVYTNTMFYKFQEQLFKGLSYRHKKVEENETGSIYNVGKEGHEQVARTIVFEPSTKSAKCSCQLFEFGGYLCRHILKVFIVEDVQNLPEKYVVKRWTKDAKLGSIVSSESKSNQTKFEESVTSRYCGICQEGVNIASKASPYVEVFNVAKKGLARTLRKVEIAFKNLSIESDHVQGERVESDQNGEINATCVQSNIQKPLLYPPIKKHKGRNPGRKLPWIEKGGKKKKKVRMETFGGRKRKQSSETEKSTAHNSTNNKPRLECIDNDFSEVTKHDSNKVN